MPGPKCVEPAITSGGVGMCIGISSPLKNPVSGLLVIPVVIVYCTIHNYDWTNSTHASDNTNAAVRPQFSASVNAVSALFSLSPLGWIKSSKLSALKILSWEIWTPKVVCFQVHQPSIESRRFQRRHKLIYHHFPDFDHFLCPSRSGLMACLTLIAASTWDSCKIERISAQLF